jgi:hypothetical protein
MQHLFIHRKASLITSGTKLIPEWRFYSCPLESYLQVIGSMVLAENMKDLNHEYYYP